MSSEATVRAAETAGPPQLDFYRTRDEIVRAYSPATAEERLLAVQITRAWIYLQAAYQFRDEVTQKHPLTEMFENDLERYKLLNRHINDAERMWRTAVQEFTRARRRTELNSRAATGSGTQRSSRSRRDFDPAGTAPAATPHNPHPAPQAPNPPPGVAACVAAAPASPSPGLRGHPLARLSSIRKQRVLFRRETTRTAHPCRPLRNGTPPCAPLPSAPSASSPQAGVHRQVIANVPQPRPRAENEHREGAGRGYRCHDQRRFVPHPRPKVPITRDEFPTVS